MCIQVAEYFLYYQFTYAEQVHPCRSALYVARLLWAGTAGRRPRNVKHIAKLAARDSPFVVWHGRLAH